MTRVETDLKSSIRFVNHASILINHGDNGILSDPWYGSHSFHKGWNLLYENSETEVVEIINSTSYIWISHEHPDHFSINFFHKYSKTIKSNGITILFQETKDRRVVNFLRSKGFSVKELPNEKSIYLKDNLKVFCIKIGDYDSALLVDTYGEKIFNLNDCVVRTIPEANDIQRKIKKIDILLTQFSYAAWKGGKANKAWRESAALEKLKTIEIQSKVFKPRYVIPFASYVFFSNRENFYLNDSKNTTNSILKYFSNHRLNIIIMKPGDILGGNSEKINTILANNFWMELYKRLDTRILNNYDMINIEILKEYFDIYRNRVIKNNNYYLMRLVRRISPIKVFQPLTIFIKDLDLTVKFDYLDNYFHITNDQAMLMMKSESLAFIFKNSFGFDTLTVNGCFEEVSKGGFVTSTKTFAIENFNNNGIYFSLRILFNLKLIIRSFSTLIKASKKMI